VTATLFVFKKTIVLMIVFTDTTVVQVSFLYENIFFSETGALQHPPYPAGNKKDAGVLHCLSTVACVELELRPPLWSP
jgi:hypothetical protein